MTTEHEEPRYTLDEARREMALLECARQGHSWSVIQTIERPLRIVCDRCSRSHAVVHEPGAETPTASVGGGTCGAAYLGCQDCGKDFLSTGGEWGDEPTDVPSMPMADLAAALLSHACPAE